MGKKKSCRFKWRWRTRFLWNHSDTIMLNGLPTFWTIYLQIHAYPKYYWWVWAYEKQQACSSTALLWMGCPDGCTCVLASLGKPSPQPSSRSSETCSGSHQQGQCPLTGYILLFHPTLLPALWMVETSSCERDLRKIQSRPNKLFDQWGQLMLFHYLIYIRYRLIKGFPSRHQPLFVIYYVD